MEFGPILRAMRRNSVRFGLIVAEVALTLAIVTNCVGMIRESRTQLARTSGFDDDNIITVGTTPFAPELREDGALDNVLRADLVALRTLPGVRAATNTYFLPWQGGGSSTELRAQGTRGEMLRTQIYNADGGTFAALGIPVVAGRGITDEEGWRDNVRLAALNSTTREKGDDGRPKTKFAQDVVVTKAFADLVWKDGKALGRTLEDTDGDLYNVVGVLGPFYNPYGWPIHEYAVFYPNMSRSYAFGSSFLVRSAPGERAQVEKAIEKTLLGVNPGRTVEVRTLVSVRERFNSQNTLQVRLLAAVVALLLFVTALGIAGLASFSVAERTRQIGTRRALGAQKSDILRYFLLENWLVTTMGLSIGVVLAFALNLALVAQVNATRLPPLLVALGVVLLWATGFVSTLLPALRGVRVPPAIATRNV